MHVTPSPLREILKTHPGRHVATEITSFHQRQVLGLGFSSILFPVSSLLPFLVGVLNVSPVLTPLVTSDGLPPAALRLLTSLSRP